MMRRALVQGASIRKRVLRRRQIFTSFADTWEVRRNEAERVPEEKKKRKPKAA